MNCENCFCIYWKKSQCCLENIPLNTLGVCEDFIYVDLDEEMLNQEREKSLKAHQDILLCHRHAPQKV